MNDSKREDIQHKLMEFQVLQSNYQAVRQKLEKLIQDLQEVHVTKQVLEDIQNETSKPALIELGSGSFIKGKIEDTSEIIVGIGAGIAVKKKREEAIAIMEKRITDIQKVLENLQVQEMTIIKQLEELEPVLQEALAPKE